MTASLRIADAALSSGSIEASSTITGRLVVTATAIDQISVEEEFEITKRFSRPFRAQIGYVPVIVAALQGAEGKGAEIGQPPLYSVDSASTPAGPRVA